MKTSFSFPKSTDSSSAITPIAMSMDNFGIYEDEPESCTLTNTKAGIDQPEFVTFQRGSLKRVPSKITNQNPPKVANGTMYGVRIDELLRVSSDEGETLYDLPVTVNLTIKHALNAAITEDAVIEIVDRMLGLLHREDGTWRIKELMRGACKPSEMKSV